MLTFPPLCYDNIATSKKEAPFGYGASFLRL